MSMDDIETSWRADRISDLAKKKNISWEEAGRRLDWEDGAEDRRYEAMKKREEEELRERGVRAQEQTNILLVLVSAIFFFLG